jgi:hypothetical protein
MSNSGNWSDPNVWTAGSVPVTTSGTTASPVSVGQTVTIDQNISITSGVYYFGYTGSANSSTNATDQTGTPAYTLTAQNGAYSATAGIMQVRSGTTTFEGAGLFDNFNLTVNFGATLILGGMTIQNKCVINVNGTLIINGDLTNNNNGSGSSFNIGNGGLVLVYGNYSAPVGNVSVAGGGDLFTTGSLTTTGSSTTFGTKNDCGTGPCSGHNLCSFTNSASASQVVCSGTAPANLTGTSSGSSFSTIQWQGASSLGGFTVYGSASSAADPCTGCNITGATSLTYSPTTVTTSNGAPVSTRFYRLYLDDGSCQSYSFPVQILTLSDGTGGVTSVGWRSGSGSPTDWSTGGNWCGNTAPTSIQTAYIYPFPSGYSGSMPIIGTADADVGRVIIASNTLGNSPGTLTLNAGRTLNIYGTNTIASTTAISFNNSGSFTSASTGTVKFLGATSSSATQTIGGTTASTFGNLSINTSGSDAGVTLKANNVIVSGTLTMTSGNVNLNGLTLQLGTSASSTGSLSYSSGWMYGGNIQRYMPNSTAISVGSAAAQFPIGTFADDRLMYFGIPSLTTGGWIKVSHTSASTTTTGLNITDGANTITNRQDSYWTVSTNGISTASTFSIRADGYSGATGFGTIGAASDLRLMLNASVTGTAGTNAGTNPYQVNRTGISLANLANNWYWGSINATQTPLPVSFIDFTGEAMHGQTHLKWSTASETNNEYFSISRSSNGEEFISIGKVKGQGTSNEQHEYSLVDFTPVTGRNYYRLSQTDFDGKTAVLKTIAVDIENTNLSTKIYPNPIAREQTLNIEITGYAPTQLMDVQLINMQGTILHQRTVQTNDQGNLSVSYTPTEVASGVYILKIGNLRTRIVIL